MLDVRFADRKIVTFPYHSLRKVTYQPAGAIVLHFHGEKVPAEGSNLHRLRDAIVERRARSIQEGTDVERDRKAPDSPFHRA
jgi:hypothetical protein